MYQESRKSVPVGRDDNDESRTWKAHIAPRFGLMRCTIGSCASCMRQRAATIKEKRKITGCYAIVVSTSNAMMVRNASGVTQIQRLSGVLVHSVGATGTFPDRH